MVWWGWLDSNQLTQREQIYSLPRLTICAASPRDGDQYDAFVVLDRLLVWVAGFEPAASAFRERPSTGLTLHPEIEGRGREVAFIVARIIQIVGGSHTAGSGAIEQAKLPRGQTVSTNK